MRDYQFTDAELSRFWASVDRTGSCWTWKRVPSLHGGYGSFVVRRNNKRIRYVSHRISFWLENGPIPDGKQIDHTCHNPLCVRPDHLRPVNHKENQENLTGANRLSKSGVRGVYMHGCGKWLVQVCHNGVRYNGGLHVHLADAEAAATELRNRLFTHNDADRKAA